MRSTLGKKNKRDSSSLLVPPALLWAPALKLCYRATTLCPEQQDRTAIWRGHLPELSPKALVIRIGLSAAFPRELVDVLGARFDAVRSLELEIELHGFFDALAAGAMAAPGAGATETFKREEGGGEEDDEAKGVGDNGEIDVEVDGWVGEEDGERVEDVGEVGADEESAG